MVKNLKARLRSEEGNSLISAIFIVPVMLFLLLTTVDYSIYLANRGQIQGIARDGARTVAIMGGDGTATKGTGIEVKYGVGDRSVACSGFNNAGITSNSSPIECNVAKALENQTGLVNVKINSVTCNPSKTNSIGARTYCEVKWQYNGIPGSGLGLANSIGGKQDVRLNGQNVTTGAAESEVNLSSQSLVNR